MRTMEKKLDISASVYPLEKIRALSDFLFFDIETTGLSAEHAKVYLIGCSYFLPDGYHLTQWFNETGEPEEEAQIIEQFFQFSLNYKCLIHFNGNHFDVPFLKKRAEKYQLTDPLSSMGCIDLYKAISPYKSMLGLANCKQQTMEAFFETGRVEERSGKDLIAAYEDYLREHSDAVLDILLAHNAADVEGLISILPALAYQDLFQSQLSVYKAQANYYDDYNGSNLEEMILFFTCENPLPKPLLSTRDHCFIKIEGNKGVLKVPIKTMEMKYFYANYKEYYYLPVEDQAMHKSIATYVDSTHREPAKASNCYTRKTASFLPEWSLFETPFFKIEYTDPQIYFEMTSEMKKDRGYLSKYATYVLSHIANEK